MIISLYTSFVLLYFSCTHYDGCGEVDPCTGKVKNKLWVVSDNVVKIEVSIKRKEYKVGKINFEGLRLIVKNVSDKIIYFPASIHPYGGIMECSVRLISNDNSKEIRIKESYENSLKFYSPSLPSVPLYGYYYEDGLRELYIDNIIPIYPGHFIGVELDNLNFMVSKAGEYKIVVRLFFNDFREGVKNDLKYHTEDKFFEYKAVKFKELYDKIWSGCIESKPIDIVIKD